VKTIYALILLILGSIIAQAADEYNREECDSVINVKKYLVAGSLDNKSAGGKTYNFERIVGDLENELLSGEKPRSKNFECLNMLHKKANEDATEYWSSRLAKSTCAGDDGEPPKVKPADCDDDTWDKFHASKALIDRSAYRVKKLTKDCVVRNGVSSCQQMKALLDIQELAEPLAENNMDKCCDMESGSGFKVLRSFYTIEFSDTTDADLQKECYKRTRPGNTGAFSLAGAGKCIKGILWGLGEAVAKWFKMAKSLTELGSLSEIWGALTSPGIGAKIFGLLKAMGEQFSAQLGASVNCFTGEYQAEQICKLSSSLIVDFFVGGGIAKGIGFLLKVVKAGVKDIALIAKELVSAGASKIVSKIRPTGAASRAATSTATRVASKKAASNLAVALKPVGDFSKSVAARVRKLREREKITPRNASNGIEPTMNLGPNAATTVAAAEPGAAVAAQTTTASTNAASQAASRTSSGASSGSVKLTTKTVGKIEKDIRAFKDVDYKAMYATKGTRAIDAPETLFVNPKRLAGKTPAQRMKIIEDAAAAKRANVDRLANTSHARRLTQAQARELRNNIDDAVARVRSRYGLPNNGAAGAAARVATSGSAAVPADLTGAVAKGIDTTIPTTPTSTAQTTATVGTSQATATNFMNTSVSFAENLPKVDIQAIASASTKINKTLQQQLDNMTSFEQRARANAAAANPSSTARSSVWANQSNRAISKDAIRRHGEIEELYKKGLINDQQAHAMHDIVRVTENSATGTATRYSTQYISTPNTNPGTFVLKERNPPLTAGKVLGNVSTGGDIGSLQTNKQAYETSDAANSGRYNRDTVNASVLIVQKLTPTSVRNEFSKLKTEDDILDLADDLRIKVKTVEANLGANPEEGQPEKLNALFKAINDERDRAIARIKAAEPSKAPASTDAPKAGPAAPVSTPIPSLDELKQTD